MQQNNNNIPNIVKPARQIASFEVQPKTSSGKPAGLPLSVDVEPKEKKKPKRREKKHYANLMRMNCKDDAGVIKQQYCAESKKFSANFYRRWGDRTISSCAIYDDGDKWALGAVWLSMYPNSIRNGIMTFLLNFKPLGSESSFIANKVEEMRLLIHEAEKAHFRAFERKRKRFKEYGPPPTRRARRRRRS